MALQVEQDVRDTWKALSQGNSVENWCCAQFTIEGKTPKLSFFGKGSGGFNELLALLKENQDKMLSGVFKVTVIGSDGAKYPKFVYFRMITKEIKPMLRAKLTTHIDSIADVFPVKHLSYTLDEDFAKFDHQNVAKEFDRVSENIVQASAYNFGPEQEIQWVKQQPQAKAKKNP